MDVGRGEEADSHFRFEGFVSFLFFISIFHLIFFTSTELDSGFPRRVKEMDGSLQGGAWERAASSK